MKRDNVAIVREGYEALNSGDFDALFALFTPEVEVRPGVDVPGFDLDEVYHGSQGFLEFFGKMAEVWEGARWEPEDFIAAGDHVVVFIRFTATGKESGVPVEQPIAHVCTLEDGKLVKHVTFWNHDTALEAAGIPNHGD